MRWFLDIVQPKYGNGPAVPDEGDGAPVWLVVVALALGAAGLAAGLLGLAAARRGSA
jgi:hypothetical protein